jgi:death-on-curing protein
LLESSLDATRNSYEFANASLAEQSSILFYSLIKNHPFRNGNKRIAVMALLVFLNLNQKWLEIKPGLLYRVAMIVAKSKPDERDLVLKENAEIFEEFTIDAKP